MNVREINRVEDLAPLRSAWEGLLARTPRATFFQSLDWLEVYWRHSGRGQRLRVLVVEEGGEPIGVAPLVVRREATKVGRLAYLTYPMDHWGSFYGPVGEDPQRVFAACLDHLKETGLGADVFEPRWLTGEEDECDRTVELLRAAGRAPQRTDFEPTAVIDLADGWEAYLASRTSKWRNNLKRWRRRVEALGSVEYVRHRPDAGEDADPRWDLYDECLRIASTSWQGASQTGTTLTHDGVAAFLRDAHAAAARCGSLDMNLLHVDGRAVAFAYNYVFRGQVYGLRVGYDPSVRDAGAGNLLYAMAIEDSCRRGDWRYDLGPRHLEMKRALMTAALPIYRLTCCKRWSPRQRLLMLKRQWDARSAPPIVVPGAAAPTPTTA